MNPEELITLGFKREQSFIVEEKHSALHIGSGSVGVLSTPSMISFMEITARILLDEHLPDSHTTVGVHVDVRHTAAAQIGAEVRASVRVLERQGRRIHLSVEVWEGERQLGMGSHERVVVDKRRFLSMATG
jgi:fluoroacetyl-CoA thioesterase